MKKILSLFLFFTFVSSCKNGIKNENAKVEVEQGTEISSVEKPSSDEPIKSKISAPKSPIITTDQLLGFWVGYFIKDKDRNHTKTLYVDERYIWNRENKINLSIDQIIDTLVIGHSVVAGNDRPFQGVVKRTPGSNGFSFKLKEPGDHKYDGEFTFTILNNKLIGQWTAYKNIDVKHRKYTLKRKTFNYDPDRMLEPSKEYINWNKVMKTTEYVEMEENEFEEWISSEFATATDLIYQMNASNKLLSKAEVENLKKGDLTIIRNTIYARHGYSFKNRPLRVFFDAQSWYVPVHANIKNDFTAIEKTNIQLLLKYEKNAAEYYDYFGRG